MQCRRHSKRIRSITHCAGERCRVAYDGNLAYGASSSPGGVTQPDAFPPFAVRAKVPKTATRKKVGLQQGMLLGFVMTRTYVPTISKATRKYPLFAKLLCAYVTGEPWPKNCSTVMGKTYSKNS